MKNISLKIGEKTYEKTKPTIQDWLYESEYKDKLSNAEVITDGLLAQEIVKLVSRFLGVSTDDIYDSNINLETLVKVHRNIRENIAECFIIGYGDMDRDKTKLTL